MGYKPAGLRGVQTPSGLTACGHIYPGAAVFAGMVWAVSGKLSRRFWNRYKPEAGGRL